MKTSVFSLSVLFLLFINSIWAQGPFGQFSESQILEIIRNARCYSDVEAYRGFSENEKSEARKFFNQYQDTLNALGKRGAFYYLRMIDLNSENRYGKIDHSAFSSRVTFWMFKDQYSPEETDQLARAKNFLSSDPNQLEARDQNAKLMAEAFLSRGSRDSIYRLPVEGRLNIADTKGVLPNISGSDAGKPRTNTGEENGTTAIIRNVLYAAAAATGLIYALFIVVTAEVNYRDVSLRGEPMSLVCRL